MVTLKQLEKKLSVFITEAIKERVVATPPLQQGASFIQSRSPTDNLGKVNFPNCHFQLFMEALQNGHLFGTVCPPRFRNVRR